MRLFLIRHAIAEDAAPGQRDADRKLTNSGRRKMAKVAAGLRRIVGDISILGSSPLIRAMETAQIISREFEDLAVARLDALKPGKPLKSVLTWLQGQSDNANIALVGHEPQLGLLASWLLSGEQHRSFVTFKKAGVCCLWFDKSLQSGKAALEWHLKPSQIKALDK